MNGIDELREVLEIAQTIFPPRFVIVGILFVIGMLWYSVKGRRGR